MGRSKQGWVLIQTLLMMSVIATLVLSSMKQSLINQKLLNAERDIQLSEIAAYQWHSKIAKSLSAYIDKCPPILLETYKKGDSQIKFCKNDDNQQYLIVDAGIDCCVLTEQNQHAHFYQLTTLKSLKKQIMITSHIILNDFQASCQCQAVEHANIGIISQYETKELEQ